MYLAGICRHPSQTGNIPNTLIFLSPVLYFTPGLHWFVSEGFTPKLPPAVFYVVLLSKDLMFLTARLWEGSGWTVGESERCAFASPPSVYQEKGFMVHHRVLKGLKKTDRPGLRLTGGGRVLWT